MMKNSASILWRTLMAAPLQRIACVFFLAALAACTQPPALPTQALADRASWSGRLALQIEDQAAQSFSAAFELQGNAQQGELILLNPLGNTLAKIQWTPAHAQIRTGGQTSESTSLDDLLQKNLGTPIPVQAFFSWLRGEQTTAAGWQADLSTIEQGRLVATRYDPAPRATLRLAFEH